MQHVKSTRLFDTTPSFIRKTRATHLLNFRLRPSRFRTHFASSGAHRGHSPRDPPDWGGIGAFVPAVISLPSVFLSPSVLSVSPSFLLGLEGCFRVGFCERLPSLRLGRGNTLLRDLRLLVWATDCGRAVLHCGGASSVSRLHYFHLPQIPSFPSLFLIPLSPSLLCRTDLL